MKKLRTILSFALLCLAISSSMAQNDPFLLTINVNQADSIIKVYSDSSNFVILDVRTPAEFETGRIETAINRDFYNSGFNDSLAKLDKNLVYLVYCHSGGRSNAASNKMRDTGFKYVYNMSGGITAWIGAGYPVVTGGTGVDIMETSMAGGQFYPNPATIDSRFYLSADTKASVRIIIYSQIGQKVSELTIEPGESGEFGHQKLSNGLYFYQVFDNEKLSQTGKIIK